MSEYISATLRDTIRERAGFQCEYCLLPEAESFFPFEPDHIIALKHDGLTDLSNLASSCLECNNAKSAQTECRDPITGQSVPLFNPRRQSWSEHFVWSDDGKRILGKTPIGRATIVALQLNNLISVVVRRHWVAAGWHPPDVNSG